MVRIISCSIQYIYFLLRASNPLAASYTYSYIDFRAGQMEQALGQVIELESQTQYAVTPEAGSVDGGEKMKQTTGLSALIAQMAAGRESALSTFYDISVQKVFSLAIRITRDQSTAEEVVADVYYQVWQQANSYQADRGSPMAWLMTIAYSRSLDAQRRLTRNRTVPLEENNTDVIDYSDPESMALEFDRQSQVHAALRQLGPVQRQLVTLSFFRGFSHQDLSEFTGIPLGTVKSHIQRSMKKLRQLIPDSVELQEGIQ